MKRYLLTTPTREVETQRKEHCAKCPLSLVVLAAVGSLRHQFFFNIRRHPFEGPYCTTCWGGKRDHLSVLVRTLLKSERVSKRTACVFIKKAIRITLVRNEQQHLKPDLYLFDSVSHRDEQHRNATKGSR